MELLNRVAVFQSCQNLSDVIAEGTKQGSDNREPIKAETKHSDCVSVMASVLSSRLKKIKECTKSSHTFTHSSNLITLTLSSKNFEMFLYRLKNPSANLVEVFASIENTQSV